MKHLNILLLSLTMFGLIHCAEEESGNAGASCQTQEDCADGLVCESGMCMEFNVGCRSVEDCSDGQACESGQCIEPPARCAANQDCEGDLICESGVCIEPPREICGNGQDDDGNGDTDCDDDACAELFECTGVCVDDAYDEGDGNDSELNATRLEPGNENGLVMCAVEGENERDVFEFVLCAEGTLNIDVIFSHSQGDIDAFITDARQGMIIDGNSTTDDESFEYTTPVIDPQGTIVYLEVFPKADQFFASDYSIQSEVRCPNAN